MDEIQKDKKQITTSIVDGPAHLELSRALFRPVEGVPKKTVVFTISRLNGTKTRDIEVDVETAKRSTAPDSRNDTWIITGHVKNPSMTYTAVYDPKIRSGEITLSQT